MNAINAFSPTFNDNKQIKIRRVHMPSDEGIIAEFKLSGNKRTLSPLFKKYNEKLFGLAYYYLGDRESSMDTVMEVYEVVLKNISEKEITYYKGWVMSICRNICLKKLRDGRKFSELTEVADSFVENDENWVYSDETIEKLIELIPELKENQKLCVEAFYLKSKSYEEISERYGLSFKEVKSHIQNGKRNLKLLFERDFKGTN